jgi:hypothetical protein
MAQPAPILAAARELIPQQITYQRQITAQVTMQLLRQRGGNLQGKIIPRDLQFSDLLAGTVRGTNSATVSTTYVGLIANVTLPVNQAVGIYGIVLYDPTPTIDAVKFQLGGAQTMAWVNLGPIVGDNNISKGYFEPVYWGPQEIIQIQAVSSTSQTAGNISFDFLGIIAEPTGLNVAPREDLDDLISAVKQAAGAMAPIAVPMPVQ